MSAPLDAVVAGACPRIVIDGVFFQFAPTGIARVWTRVIRDWISRGLANRLLIVDRGGTLPTFDDVARVTAPSCLYDDPAGDRRLLQDICDRAGADVFVSTYYSSPLTTPAMVLVHDMIPEVLGWDLSHPMWVQKHQAIADAASLVAVSHHTAKDLVRWAGRPLDLTVAHNGCDFGPPPADRVQAFRDRHALQRQYFMLSGSRGSYKNPELFFRAFAALGSARDGLAVVCTGGGTVDDDLRELAGTAEIHVLRLDDDDLQCAYAGAIALVYPSLYEGFGLPVLEAMACGCPVVTTRVASLPEVGGDAARYVDMGDDALPQMTAHLEAVQRPDVRVAMVEAGLRQASRFRWDAMAGHLLQRLMLLAQTPQSRPAAAQAAITQSVAMTNADAVNGAGANACRLCGGSLRAVFSKRLLHRHMVRYYECQGCGSLQTERPHWLDEAYSPENERYDTGALVRSMSNAAFLHGLLARLDNARAVVDYGCGTGLLVRLLRDSGLDAWGCDKYSDSRLCLGFKLERLPREAVVNLSEVVEHFVEPAVEFERLFATDPTVLVLQTGLYTRADPDWTYLAPEHGQHVFCFSPRGLQWLAQRYDRVLLACGPYSLFVRRDQLPRLLVRSGEQVLLALRADGESVARFAVSLVQSGYRHAAVDNRQLVAQWRSLPEAGPTLHQQGSQIAVETNTAGAVLPSM